MLLCSKAKSLPQRSILLAQTELVTGQCILVLEFKRFLSGNNLDNHLISFFKNFIFKDFIFNYACICGMHMKSGAHRGQKKDPPTPQNWNRRQL